MNVVPVDQIPKKEDVRDVPDDPMEVYKIALQMVEVCVANKGVGLAAVQVGIPWRFFVAQREDGKFDFVANASYESVNAPFPKQPSLEGCLSLRDSSGNCIRYRLQRWPQVKVTGKRLIEGQNSPEFKAFDEVKEGWESVLYQHEIDHQNGILISDIGQPIQLW